jgi:chemosensory pili system protein ChpA (sensor histidine kinase/response regulator)
MTPDRIDDALLPVFLEEGRELIAVIGDGLATLRTATDKLSLLARLRGPIHTIKGSARMMGAMQFGAHWHAVEGLIARLLKQGTVSAEEMAMLLGQYDLGVQMFTVLAHPQTISDPVAGPLAASAAAQINAVDKKSRRVEKTVSHVRIRANLLDQFLNQAGEIAIAGTHVDNGMTQLHAMAQELGSNIARVEKHVRQAGAEAEIHMQSLHQQADEETGFDALELDRFTERQELT